jgi:predicted NBD/HSP70 family sugar kinase/transcriptional regulator with XRE-family HTH domain
MTSKNAAAQQGSIQGAVDVVGELRDPAAVNAATRQLNELLESVPKDPAAAPHYQDATRRLAMLSVMPKIRGRRKLTQASVAAAMGTTQSAVSDLESGRVDPQLRTLQRYARAIQRRLDFGLVEEELPTFDEGTANGLWRLVERNALGPLLTALAIEPRDGQRRHLEDLASFVSLPPDVVQPMLASLIRMGWASSAECDDRQSFSLVDDAAYVIGVSLHHDRVAGVLVDLSSKVVPATFMSAPLADRGRSTVIDAVTQIVDRLYHLAHGHQILGVGVCIAGVVSTGDLGTVSFAPDLSNGNDAWLDVPLEGSLQEEIRRRVDDGLRVVVENDANALAMREHLQNGDHSVAVILLSGAGIGMGSVIAGNVIRGASFGAGEGGHTIVDPNGPPCRVSIDEHRGCLETLASAKGILGRLDIDVPLPELSAGLSIANDRVKRLDQSAIDAFSDAAAALGRFVSVVVAILDPSRIVFYAHQELAAERDGWPSGELFRRTVDRTLRIGLPKEGRLVQTQVEWRDLDGEVTAAAAGAGALREFLQRPVDWRPSVLPTRTVSVSA